MPRAYTVERIEKRVPIEVAVHICGDERTPGVEETFTENVSARGARVITGRRWRMNDLLMLASACDFQTVARVAYCQPRRGEGFAIGLEFLEPVGSWVVHS
jgi:hypothetical protein